MIAFIRNNFLQDEFRQKNVSIDNFPKLILKDSNRSVSLEFWRFTWPVKDGFGCFYDLLQKTTFKALSLSTIEDICEPLINTVNHATTLNQ